MEHSNGDGDGRPKYRVYMKDQRLGRDYENIIEARRAMNRATRRDRNPENLELWEIGQDGSKVRRVYQTRFRP